MESRTRHNARRASGALFVKRITNDRFESNEQDLIRENSWQSTYVDVVGNTGQLEILQETATPNDLHLAMDKTSLQYIC